MASEMSLRHYEKPIVCTYSGGKDSDVMLELFKRSGVPFEVHNSHTTVDAPHTVYHIRDRFKKLENQGIKCEIELPPVNKSDPQKRRFTMWSLIVKKKFPPTRLKRYCCSILNCSSIICLPHHPFPNQSALFSFNIPKYRIVNNLNP